jgi:uncharacterized protein YgiM (DUF1202 family)
MKMNYWLILSALVATSATAQTSSNTPALPEIPPPATTAPASTAIVPPTNVVSTTSAPAKPAKKKTATKAKKKAPAKPASTAPMPEATVALTPGPAQVMVANLNVRGQAGLKGEVVGHVQKGDTVTVISQITLDKHQANEPAQWAKILLPTNSPVWVRTSFIDGTNKTVMPKKLNLRGGPGENYSVLGVIERGTPVVETGAKGEWSKIETPTNAYAFIAAMYLKQESSGNLALNPPPSTETMPAPVPATPVTVANSEPINTTPGAPTTAPTEMNSVPPPSAPAPIIIQTNIIVIADTNPPPPPPRIVTHDGYVRPSVSPVAPTYYELYDPATGVAINYLFSSTTNLDLSRYNGYHINVTGEEGMDARWKDTPVLTVQKIYVVSTSAPSAAADAKKKKPWYHVW